MVCDLLNTGIVWVPQVYDYSALTMYEQFGRSEVDNTGMASPLAYWRAHSAAISSVTIARSASFASQGGAAAAAAAASARRASTASSVHAGTHSTPKAKAAAATATAAVAAATGASTRASTVVLPQPERGDEFKSLQE